MKPTAMVVSMFVVLGVTDVTGAGAVEGGSLAGAGGRCATV